MKNCICRHKYKTILIKDSANYAQTDIVVRPNSLTSYAILLHMRNYVGFNET